MKAFITILCLDFKGDNVNIDNLNEEELKKLIARAKVALENKKNNDALHINERVDELKKSGVWDEIQARWRTVKKNALVYNKPIVMKNMLTIELNVEIEFHEDAEFIEDMFLIEINDPKLSKTKGLSELQIAHWEEIVEHGLTLFKNSNFEHNITMFPKLRKEFDAIFDEITNIREILEDNKLSLSELDIK